MKIEKKIFELRTAQVIDFCTGEIRKLEPAEKKPFQVVITQGDDLRSIKQNKLYWKHVAEIAKQSFDGNHSIHYGLKRRHLHPIFMAGDTAKNLVYQTNYAALCKVKEAGVNIDFEILHNKMLSTTDTTVKQMKEFIDSYWIEQNQRGIVLTDPETYIEGNEF